MAAIIIRRSICLQVVNYTEGECILEFAGMEMRIIFLNYNFWDDTFEGFGMRKLKSTSGWCIRGAIYHHEESCVSLLGLVRAVMEFYYGLFVYESEENIRRR